MAWIRNYRDSAYLQDLYGVPHVNGNKASDCYGIVFHNLATHAVVAVLTDSRWNEGGRYYIYSGQAKNPDSYIDISDNEASWPDIDRMRVRGDDADLKTLADQVQKVLTCQ